MSSDIIDYLNAVRQNEGERPPDNKGNSEKRGILVDTTLRVAKAEGRVLPAQIACLKKLVL